MCDHRFAIYSCVDFATGSAPAVGGEGRRGESFDGQNDFADSHGSDVTLDKRCENPPPLRFVHAFLNCLMA